VGRCPGQYQWKMIRRECREGALSNTPGDLAPVHSLSPVTITLRRLLFIGKSPPALDANRRFPTKYGLSASVDQVRPRSTPHPSFWDPYCVDTVYTPMPRNLRIRHGKKSRHIFENCIFENGGNPPDFIEKHQNRRCREWAPSIGSWGSLSRCAPPADPAYRQSRSRPDQ